MRSERRPVVCSFCQKEFSARVMTRVDFARPEDRVDLSDGSLFTFTCPHCGKEMMLNHYLLWVDEGHTVAVCNLTDASERETTEEALAALETLGKTSSIRLRYVDSPARLCEKVQIFTAGLDDRSVEIVKLYFAEQVRKTHPDRTLTDVLFFLDGEGYAFLFRSPQGDLTVNIEASAFRTAAARFHFDAPAPTVVDANWAVAYLTGGKSC